MSWTILGAAGDPAAVAVDGKGVVAPGFGGWTLDWWVRAEDRWHHASREVAVRQGLAGDGVGIETLMRVPGGDIVHTAWVCIATGGGGPVAVVEARNDSSVPVAIAFAVAPSDLRGAVPIRDSGGRSFADPRRPGGGAPARFAGGRPRRRARRWRCSCGVPLGAHREDQGRHSASTLEHVWRGSCCAAGSRSSGAGVGGPRGPLHRVVLPEPGLARVVDVARRRLLAACGDGLWSQHAVDRPLTERDVLLAATALSELGHRAEALAALGTFGWRELPSDRLPPGDLDQLLAAASPTGAIPSDEGGGTGDDIAAAAELLLALRALLLVDADGRLDFLPEPRPDWIGQAVEIHAAPTTAGVASIAVRWHGSRPALLWDVQGEGELLLTASGLDPGWSTTERQGEALLSEFVVG